MVAAEDVRDRLVDGELREIMGRFSAQFSLCYCIDFGLYLE